MKILKKILLLVLILALLWGLSATAVSAYYNTYSMFGSYTSKEARAKSITENKYIIIGGSAANLGFDSKEFERLSGQPAVNLAISGSVPLRVYFQAAKNVAKPGDTVIMPLEFAYYNTDFFEINEIYVDMVAIDPSLKWADSWEKNPEYVYTAFLRSFTRVNDCFVFGVKDILNTQNTIYIADSVDSYGDFCLHQGRKSTYRRITGNSEFRYNETVMEQIQLFIDSMEDAGVTVYLTYPPNDGYRFLNYQTFFDQLQQAVEAHIDPAHIIGTPFDFLYEQDHFFDTYYHLAYPYRQEYTRQLYQLMVQSQ